MPSWYIAGYERLQGSAVATGYVGPGDVNPGAFAWWGLRAYSAAKIGTNAVSLFRDSDSTTMNFKTIAGGGLDLAAITSFKGSANLFMDTIYDQTGNGNDQVVNGRPNFSLNVLNGLPTFTNATTTTSEMFNNSITSPADPLAASFVYKVVSAAAASGASLFTPGNSRLTAIGGSGGTTANAIAIFDGGSPLENDSAPDNSWLAVDTLFNGSGTSHLTVNSTNVTATLTTSSSNNSFHIGSVSGTTWSFMEGGIWTSSISSLIANQRAYYGF